MNEGRENVFSPTFFGPDVTIFCCLAAEGQTPRNYSLSHTSLSLQHLLLSTYLSLPTSVCSLHTTIHNKTLKFSSIWTHVDRVEKVQPLPQPRLVKLPNLVILTAHLMTTTKTCRLYCNPIILSLVWRNFWMYL